VGQLDSLSLSMDFKYWPFLYGSIISITEVGLEQVMNLVRKQ
jgi:hypothetical protein